MTAMFPPYASKELVLERLPLIFTEGTPNRQYCVRDLAASTVFTALYVGAVEGQNVYFGPVHIYRMTDVQADKADSYQRLAYREAVRKKNVFIAGRRWYADNTREPIRDETLRDGLVAIGAVISRADLPTTSGAPRYTLKKDFAALFDPALTGDALATAITAFQNAHLSKGALTRMAIMRAGAATASVAEGVRVNFPNGETRVLASGPSSVITQAVLERFAPKFLDKPAVLWLSESSNKVVVRDETIASSIGLKIEADKNLPDLILCDLAPAHPLLVFVEVVATDGAMTPMRQQAIYTLTDAAGFERKHIAFLTAYSDRQSPGFKKTVAQLAWNTYAWFSSEPENLVLMRAGAEALGLSRLIQL